MSHRDTHQERDIEPFADALVTCGKGLVGLTVATGLLSAIAPLFILANSDRAIAPMLCYIIGFPIILFAAVKCKCGFGTHLFYLTICGAPILAHHTGFGDHSPAIGIPWATVIAITYLAVHVFLRDPAEKATHSSRAKPIAPTTIDSTNKE
jgi:hypothetical protein